MDLINDRQAGVTEVLEREQSVEPAEETRLQGDWYVVHTYSGYENKIKVDLSKRVESMNMQDKILRLLFPRNRK